MSTPSPKIARLEGDSESDYKMCLRTKGFAYLRCAGGIPGYPSAQRITADLLVAHYSHVAQKQKGQRISGGQTVQVKVDWGTKNTFDNKILQHTTDTLLEVLRPMVDSYFGSDKGKRVRIAKCSFVKTEGDTVGQIPHCDALGTNFLAGLVYLSEGTRGTEIWQHQHFEHVPHDALFDTDQSIIKRVYGEAVKAKSTDLLANFVPVQEHVGFGDILVFSPALLHRGPPSVEERLCFFFALEYEGGGDYAADYQNTIDDLALRAFHFDSPEFLACHDDWLTQGFSMSYDGGIGMHIKNAHARWRKWKDGKSGEENATTGPFFTEKGRHALSEAYGLSVLK